MVAPIKKDGHFVTAVVHFLPQQQAGDPDREIFVFDSEQKDSTPYISRSDGLRANPQLLNDLNSQGKSGTCGYFTAEFMGLASQFDNFQDLRLKCEFKQMQIYVYDQVKKILERNEKDLDQLHKSYDGLIRSFNEVGYGKIPDNRLSSPFKHSLNQLPIKQSKSQPNIQSHYWRNKIRKSKSTPNLSKAGHILD